MPISNRSTVQAQDALIIQAIEKHLSNVPSIVLFGVSYTPAKLAKLFQGEIDSANACSAAKAVYREAVKSNRVVATNLRKIRKGLRQYVTHLLGEKDTVLEDFGYAPQPSRPTVATQSLAVEKRKATREARHTMGKKQKRSIKGVVADANGSQEPAAPSPAPQGDAGSAPPTPHP